LGGFLGLGGSSKKSSVQQSAPAPVAPVDTSAKDKLDAERKRRAKLAARAETLLSGKDSDGGGTASGSLLGG
jgi:hypothetical protein